MANATNLYGLIPVRDRTGRKYDGQHNLYYVPSSYATDLFVGDPVIKTAVSNTAVVRTSTGDFPIGSLPVVQIATVGSTNRLTGVIVGFECMTIGRKGELYGPASLERVAKVADDPGLIFRVRDDGSATLASTVVGHNANLKSGAGVASSGLSGFSMDAGGVTTPVAGATLQLTILRGARTDSNAVGSASAEWDVTINLHTEAMGPGIVGI